MGNEKRPSRYEMKPCIISVPEYRLTRLEQQIKSGFTRALFEHLKVCHVPLLLPNTEIHQAVSRRGHYSL